MLPPITMPMPGALRLRALHPLIEGDGSCSLVYDLERAAVVEVPEELQFYVAPALETGDLDEPLVGWLSSEDLLTSEGTAGWWSEASATAGPPEAVWSLGVISRVDDELHVRIDQAREDAALEVVSFVFRRGFGASRVKLHLNWGGSFPGVTLLERIVVESSRLAKRLGQEITFELTLAVGEVTAGIAAFLAGYAFQVRLLCGSYPAFRRGFRTGRAGREDGWNAEPAVRLLLAALGDRLTVYFVLDRGRLLDLWEWAKQTGIRHLDVTVLDDTAFGDGVPRPGRRREIRHDLLAVCDEMADDLDGQRLPIDFKPLTRIVDRLMRSEPLDHAYGERGGFAGLVPSADAYPRAFFDSLDLRVLSDLVDPGDDAEVMAGADVQVDEPACQGCWARHVCSHSAYLGASQEGGDDGRRPSEEHCGLWRSEVEVALRFYHRLAHMDPLQVRQFFDDSLRDPAPPGRREDLGHLRMPF
jgi:hypothetical protein